MTSYGFKFNDRPLAWWGMLIVGISGLVLFAIKWWNQAPAGYPQPSPATAVTQQAALKLSPPAPASMLAAAPAGPVFKTIQTVTPASSFTPSRIAPIDLPPELAGLEPPPPDRPLHLAPIGVQPGYVIPDGPQPRNIR